MNQNINICWICRNTIADSAEHIFKKSDITRAYGNGSYKGNFAPVHVKNGVITNVQGANSSTLKYKKSICHSCNTTVTQPFDRAYDTFIKWVLENESKILKRRFIDFYEVFGENFETSQRNLYKYFAKSFGCRLVSAGHEIPDDIFELLRKEVFETGLRITFAVNEDILLMIPNDCNSFCGKGDLYFLKNNDEQFISYTWNEKISWLTIYYWYNAFPDGKLGSTWIADSQYIYLGSFDPLPPEIREDFIKKLVDN
ncbi:hypothetical protein BAC3_02273 [uncultured bacterium]|nr:hypothetical protein BAC3_02273 [uncultured bacterium]